MYASVYTLDFLILPLLSHTWSRCSRQTNIAMIGLHLLIFLLPTRCTAWNLILEVSMPRSLSMMLYTTSLQSSSSLSLMLLNLRFSRPVYCLRFVFRSTWLLSGSVPSQLSSFLVAPFPRFVLLIQS